MDEEKPAKYYQLSQALDDNTRAIAQVEKTVQQQNTQFTSALLDINKTLAALNSSVGKFVEISKEVASLKRDFCNSQERCSERHERLLEEIKLLKDWREEAPCTKHIMEIKALKTATELNKQADDKQNNRFWSIASGVFLALVSVVATGVITYFLMKTK
jgi:hypothetical protein